MKDFTFFLVLFLVAFLSLAAMAQSPWILQRASGLPNSVNPEVVLAAVDDNICWGIKETNSQFLRTTNGGTNWTVSTITGATGLHGSSISALDADIAWVAMNDPSNATSGGIFKTTDAGLTWEKQTTAFPGTGGYPNVIHFFDINNGVCTGNVNGGNWEIYTTTNGGTNWTRVPSGNIPSPLTGEIGESGGNENINAGNHIWFATLDGSLYKTTNRGITWSVARNIIGNGNGFGFAFKDSLNGLACTFVGDNILTNTSDGGASWTQILPLPDGLSGISPFFLAYAKGSGHSYVITSNNNIGAPFSALPGSAYTNDNGATWTPVNNLPYGSATFASDRIGWSAGINDSLYKWDSDLLVTSVQTISGELPNEFNLKQNYPNPFNPSTTIQFQIPNSSFVNIKVYDVLGNEVATLVNEEKPAGSYEVEFSAKGGSASGGNAYNLTSGIYFYKLQAGSFSETKKMILLR